VRSSLLASILFLLFASHLQAEDVVIVVNSADPAAKLRVAGAIVDYTGRELTIRLPGGSERRFPSEQVLDVESSANKDQVAADALFDARQWADALAKYQIAARGEKRRWAQRWIIARLVECSQRTGNIAMAAEYFLGLVRDDPATQYFPRIPLAWLPGETRPELEQLAEKWLARSGEPAAVLLGASYLLTGQKQGAARAKLDELTASADPRIASLAEAQTWRIRFTTTDPAELATWANKLDRFPEPLRAGPYVVLARAFFFQRQFESAALSAMRVPILYPDQRELAAEGLWLAAESLRSLEKKTESAGVCRELLADYPDSRWTAEARARLEGANDGDSNSPDKIN
jgi:tetratricopeptide (TPR) repeat protein